MATTLSKPADLPVFPPHGDAHGDCLLARLLETQPWRNDIHWPAGFEGGIAHRLDNATSGVVLAADSLEELDRLRGWFRAHQFIKTYRMLAACDVPWREKTCDLALGHHARRKRLMVARRGLRTAHRGKWYPAETRFRRLSPRLVEVTMRSGVMHQIRVHAAVLGIPILGDTLYGGAAAALPLLKEAPVFFLHHVGLTGPDGFASEKAPLPPWARVGV